MPETTLLIKAALNLRVGAVFDVYEKRTGERGKEELPLKQKATVCTPPKGADRGYFFNFRPRHFQPWAN